MERYTRTQFNSDIPILVELISKLDSAIGRAVTRSSLEREIRGLNLGQVKSVTVLSTAGHRCDIYSKEAVLPAGAMTRYTFRRNTAS